jgi:probable O-glycosylation ligase (exosortase A-associated)
VLDLALAVFLAAFMALGIRRPFLWVLAYLYVDILAPQKISWSLLTSLPVSLITFVAAFAGWLFIDDKKDTSFSFRQVLMLILLVYCGVTTLGADFPAEAAEKWAWVWKALVFAIFLPLVLRTRLRIEAAALVMVLTVGAIIICGGIKTAISGGGYGELKLFVNDNNGLYEGSIISCVATAVIPLIFWLMKHGTIFKPEWRVRLFGLALVFSCLLIPVGTQARTGLICIGVLALLMLRSAKRRFLYLGIMASLTLVAVPFLPQKFTERMNTISNHQADQSASTRVAVWKWTWEYAQDHPFGGGFEAYRANRIRYETKAAETSGSTTSIESAVVEDKSRAFHSAYFEMLGEQGWPGLSIWLLLHVLGLFQLESIRRRLRSSQNPRDQSDRSLAEALQHSYLVYLVGALFVGIAFQPFVYMLIGLQIGLTNLVARRQRQAASAALRLQLRPKPATA